MVAAGGEAGAHGDAVPDLSGHIKPRVGLFGPADRVEVPAVTENVLRNGTRPQGVTQEDRLPGDAEQVRQLLAHDGQESAEREPGEVGFAYAAPFLLLAPLVWGWGFFVVADSAQFSALVTEVAPREGVGTALTLQTSMGFLLTLSTIQLVPVLVERIGWAWAFPILALGPFLGIFAMAELRRLRASG